MNPGIFGLTSRTATPPSRLLGQPSPIPTIDPAVAFDVRNIPNLELWLDAADDQTLGPTSAGPGQLINAGPVKFWGDKSGWNRHATQTGADSAAPTFAPAALNGKSTLTLTGTAWMQGAYTGLPTLVGQTTFIVARMSSASGVYYGRLFSQTDASVDYQSTGHYIPALRVANTTTFGSYASSNERATVTLTQQAWFVFRSRHTGSQIQNNLNNGPNSTYSHTLNKLFTKYLISTDQALAYWWGDIAEIVMYSRSLSDTESARVFKHLGAKWAITVV